MTNLWIHEATGRSDIWRLMMINDIEWNLSEIIKIFVVMPMQKRKKI